MNKNSINVQQKEVIKVAGLENTFQVFCSEGSEHLLYMLYTVIWELKMTFQVYMRYVQAGQPKKMVYTYIVGAAHWHFPSSLATTHDFLISTFC